MRNFEKKYKVQSRDNLGDATYWNGRLLDVDLRLASLENGLANVDAVGARVEALALDRINNVVTPLVVETIQRVAQIPELFRASSSSEASIGTGGRQFIIDQGQRLTFAAMSWVRIIPTADITLGMTAEVVSLDRNTGVLVVDVAQSFGTGTFADWTIYVAAPPDLQHETRLDNPHGTTAAQVGAYTAGAVDSLIAALTASTATALGLKAPLNSPPLTGTPTAPTATAGTNTTQIATTAFVMAVKNAILNGAGPAFDTLQELQAALGNDANFAATVTAALALKANLASADFPNLSAAGRRIYGTLPISAVGGDESDINVVAQVRLSVTFVAIGPWCAAKAVMTADNQGAANFPGTFLRITDVTGGNTLVVQGAMSTYAAANASAALASVADNPVALTIGNTYRIDLYAIKSIAAGPIYPRNMRISAQNF